MPDARDGRERRDRERRGLARDLAAALARGSEPTPFPVDDDALAAVDERLETLSFPTTGAAVVAAAGEQPVRTGDRTYAVAELVPDDESVRFQTPEDVRVRLRRPRVAAGLCRISAASDQLPNAAFEGRRREAYERTLLALVAVDSSDGRGVTVVADWAIERARERGRLPDSRAFRRRAARYCREHGHEVRDDGWLNA